MSLPEPQFLKRLHDLLRPHHEALERIESGFMADDVARALVAVKRILNDIINSRITWTHAELGNRLVTLRGRLEFMRDHVNTPSGTPLYDIFAAAHTASTEACQLHGVLPGIPSVPSCLRLSAGPLTPCILEEEDHGVVVLTPRAAAL